MATEVSHKCGHVLGTFEAVEDHGSFMMQCPKCKEWLEIFNPILENPGDWNNPDASIIYTAVDAD